MPIDFECPNCLRDLTFEDAQAGTQVKCPNPKCRAEFTLPDPAEADAPYGLGIEVVCPHCQKGMAPDAVVCIECGYDFRTGKKVHRRMEEKDVVQRVDGTRFHFHRDRKGRWELGVEGRLLGVKTGARDFDLGRYQAVVAAYDHDGSEEGEDEVTVYLEGPGGRRERVYRGINKDLVDWLAEMFRDEVGLPFRHERA
jgi:hypothetical protein